MKVLHVSHLGSFMYHYHSQVPPSCTDPALVTQILPPDSPKAPQCPSLSCLKKRLIGMRTYKNIGDTYKQKWMLPSVSSFVCSSLPYLFSHPFPLPHSMLHYSFPPPHDSHPSPGHFLFSSLSSALTRIQICRQETTHSSLSAFPAPPSPFSQVPICSQHLQGLTCHGG